MIFGPKLSFNLIYIKLREKDGECLIRQCGINYGRGTRIGLYWPNSFGAGQPVVFTYRTPRAEVEALKAKGAIGFQVDLPMRFLCMRF